MTIEYLTAHQKRQPIYQDIRVSTGGAVRWRYQVSINGIKGFLFSERLTFGAKKMAKQHAAKEVFDWLASNHPMPAGRSNPVPSAPNFPQLGRKRARSPSPGRYGPANGTRATKRRKDAEKVVKTTTFIDLTEDDQENQDAPAKGVGRVKRFFSAFGSILTSGKIIDLTED